MARKVNRDVPTLSDQIDRAIKDGNPTVALTLAKRFVAESPSDISRGKLRRAYLECVKTALEKGQTREATAFLNEAEAISGDLKWWEELILGRIDVGDYPRANQLADATNQPHLKPKIVSRMADRAIKDGANGKKLLPPELHAGFDLVLKAFHHYELGKDEESRETLQAIGLSSPFLEWKILLRGLMAYTAKDDAKAIENWSRLDASRLCAKLCAPLRLHIDETFRNAQSQRYQKMYARQFNILDGDSPVAKLKEAHKIIAGRGSLDEVWPLIRPVFPAIHKQSPALAARVQHVLYWDMIDNGGPRDIDHFSSVVGFYPGDPQMTRLRALVMENLEDSMQKSSDFWKQYEQWIEKNPDKWPSGQSARARARIWVRMGDNATEVLQEIVDFDPTAFNPFAAIFGGRGQMQPPKPLKPDPETCFKQAYQLCPDWILPAARLFAYYNKREENDKAEAILKELVAKYPNDLSTLMAAVELHSRLGRTVDALDFARRAMQANPLDRNLRAQVASLAFAHARSLIATDDIAGARTTLSEASSLCQQKDASRILCLNAILEEKAKNLSAAEEIREQLAKIPNERLAIVYRFAVEAGRLKLPPKRKKELEAPLKELFDQPIPINELMPLISAMGEYGQEAVKYRGYLTHTKKVRSIVEKILKTKPDESEWKELGFQLIRLKMWPQLLTLASLGERAFRNNPYFFYFEAEYGAKNPSRLIRTYVHNGFSHAHRIVRAAPAGTYRDLEEPLKRLQTLDPWLINLTRPSIYENFFGGGSHDEFDDDYDD